MTTNNIALMEFEGNANIGLFFFVNDKFAILGKEVTQEKLKEIESLLKVPIYKTQVLGTELAGVFLAGNNDLLLVPQIYNSELKKLQEICKKHDTELIEIDEKLNTFGNNLCVGNQEIIINSNYSREFIKKIEKLTKLKTIKLKSDEYTSAGSVCFFVKENFFVSQELDEKILKDFINKIKGVGSINSGSAFISSGVVANKNGILIGSQSSTIEIQNLLETLEYI